METEGKEQVYFDDNLDVVNFWVQQITMAREFYLWYQSLIQVRYRIVEGADNPQEFISDADFVLNRIMKLSLPEVDRDAYRASLGISAMEYARQRAKEFQERIGRASRQACEFNNSGGGDSSNSNITPVTHTNSSMEHQAAKSQTTKTSELPQNQAVAPSAQEV